MKRALLLSIGLSLAAISSSFADQDITVKGCGIAAESASKTGYVLEMSEGNMEVLFPSSIDPTKLFEDGLFDEFVHALGMKVCIEGTFVDSRTAPGTQAVLVHDIEVQH
jgi:hypothetical protein